MTFMLINKEKDECVEEMIQKLNFKHNVEYSADSVITIYGVAESFISRGFTVAIKKIISIYTLTITDTN